MVRLCTTSPLHTGGSTFMAFLDRVDMYGQEQRSMRETIQFHAHPFQNAVFNIILSKFVILVNLIDKKIHFQRT